PDERFPDAASMRDAIEGFLLDRAKPTTADGLARLVRDMFADRLALVEDARKKGDDDLFVEALRVNAKPRGAMAREAKREREAKPEPKPEPRKESKREPRRSSKKETKSELKHDKKHEAPT